MKPALTDSLKPLLATGGLYVLEVGRALLVGGLISAAGLVLLITQVPLEAYNRWIYGLGVASVAVFTLAYALAGHQRGLARVLARLTQSHGGALFDHSVGRLLSALEARQPGALSGLIATPHKLAAGLQQQVGSLALRPAWLRRVALRYLGRLTEAVSAQSALPEGVVQGGQLDREGFKRWAVATMQEQLSPSWRGFVLVFAVHVLALVALVWRAH